MAETLTLAQHDQQHRYWKGGHYELNMSFARLLDKQWPQVMQALWQHPALHGPLDARYAPGTASDTLHAARVAVQAPPPTASLIQHRQINIQGAWVGCDVQATRSLFECVSVLIPMGMFSGLSGGPYLRRNYPELGVIDTLYYDIALHIYDTVPFQIAVIGYERSCQLISELREDSELRHNFLVFGHFLAQENVLQEIEPDLTPYSEVRPGLFYMQPRL